MIIGGHRKKTEKVLQYLQRMYMPVKNYFDLEPELLDSYRQLGKDVLPVYSFSSLVPEVFSFGETHLQLLQSFCRNRLNIELAPISLTDSPIAREEIDQQAATLRKMAGESIRLRLEAIQNHMRKQGSS